VSSYKYDDDDFVINNEVLKRFEFEAVFRMKAIWVDVLSIVLVICLSACLGSH
jgi:hypothetical protein